jgi:hypothetical protein
MVYTFGDQLVSYYNPKYQGTNTDVFFCYETLFMCITHTFFHVKLYFDTTNKSLHCAHLCFIITSGWAIGWQVTYFAWRYFHKITSQYKYYQAKRHHLYYFKRVVYEYLAVTCLYCCMDQYMQNIVVRTDTILSMDTTRFHSYHRTTTCISII